MVVNAKVSLRQRRTKLDDLLTYDGPLADSDQEEFVALMESEAVSSRILKPPSDCTLRGLLRVEYFARAII